MAANSVKNSAIVSYISSSLSIITSIASSLIFWYIDKQNVSVLQSYLESHWIFYVFIQLSNLIMCAGLVLFPIIWFLSLMYYIVAVVKNEGDRAMNSAYAVPALIILAVVAVANVFTFVSGF